MADRLSWDDVYPLMDEVKALHPADLQVDDLSQALEREPAQVVALLDALTELKQVQPQRAEAIEHRFYGGLTLEDTVRMMAIDERTTRPWWDRARPLLAQRILQLLNAERPGGGHP